MSTEARDKAIQLAIRNKVLEPVFRQLWEHGGFLLNDGTDYWEQERMCGGFADETIGSYLITEVMHEGRSIQCICIVGPKETKWGVTIGASPDGEPEGVCYFNRHKANVENGGPVYAQEDDWPGVVMAVNKARLYVDLDAEPDPYEMEVAKLRTTVNLNQELIEKCQKIVDDLYGEDGPPKPEPPEPGDGQ